MMAETQLGRGHSEAEPTDRMAVVLMISTKSTIRLRGPLHDRRDPVLWKEKKLSGQVGRSIDVARRSIHSPDSSPCTEFLFTNGLTLFDVHSDRIFGSAD